MSVARSVSKQPPEVVERRITLALRMLELGAWVFPLAHESKAPFVPKSKGGEGFKDAKPDPDMARTFLSNPGQLNYGVVFPPESDMIVLDIDGGDGKGTGWQAQWQALYDRLGPPGLTFIVRTPSGGRHAYYRWRRDLYGPIPPGDEMLGWTVRKPWKGYLVGPGSVIGDQAYESIGADAIADLPEDWARAAIAEKLQDAIVVAPASPSDVPIGKRHIYLRNKARRLRGAGLTGQSLYAAVMAINQELPDPKTEDEVRRAIGEVETKFGTDSTDPDFDDVVVPEAVQQARSSAASADWPDPIDDAAFHGPVGAVVRAVADITEADPVGILGSLLATIGTCMGHYRYVYQGGAQATNLFVVLVGGSSSGRKGTAGSIARDVMTSAYPEWQDLIVAGLGSGEGLVTHLTPRDERNEHRALVMESEFARLLSSMARDGSTLSPMIRDAWDGVPMGRVLARESRIVKFHHVGILAHITPVELRARLTNTDAANGFGNRFLWLAVRRTQFLPFPKSPNGRVPVDALSHIHAAIADGLTPGELAWSNAAAEAWESFYLEVANRDTPGLFGAMVARAEAQVARLALLYALIDRSSVIGVEHLAAARALWTYSERSVEHVFGRSTGNADADALLAYLAEGPLPWEKARDAIGARRASVLADAVDVLSRLGLAEVVSVPRKEGGRAQRWVKRPDQTMQTMQTVQGHAQ